MEYKHVNGPVYCRFAVTPPVINSDLADQIGIVAPCQLDERAGSHVGLKAGSNVKLRMLLDNRSQRITCHAKIDWVREDEWTERCNVAFSHLSLSDDEFQVMLENCVEQPGGEVEFVETVRNKGMESAPVTLAGSEKDIVRVKAITLPVSLIEEIDAKRGSVAFSEFVATALLERLKD